ncbi:MAG: hypothetical protein CMB79_00940 [Filomicrobium sp.]|nr:hypothetical protein [Filomicrobium sp.]
MCSTRNPALFTRAAIALRQMIDLISTRTGLSKAEAYALCSLATDLRFTQVASIFIIKGIHVMLTKEYLVGRG